MQRLRGAPPRKRAAARPRRRGQPRAQVAVGGDPQERVGEPVGVARRDAQRPVAERLGEDGQVADDARRAERGRLDRRQPEALEPRRRDDRERAGVERRELGVVRPAGTRRTPGPSIVIRPSPTTTRSASSPCARARAYAAARTSGALRGSSAPTNRRYGRASSARAAGAGASSAPGEHDRRPDAPGALEVRPYGVGVADDRVGAGGERARAGRAGATGARSA